MAAHSNKPYGGLADPGRYTAAHTATNCIILKYMQRAGTAIHATRWSYSTLQYTKKHYDTLRHTVYLHEALAGTGRRWIRFRFSYICLCDISHVMPSTCWDNESLSGHASCGLHSSLRQLWNHLLRAQGLHKGRAIPKNVTYNYLFGAQTEHVCDKWCGMRVRALLQFVKDVYGHVYHYICVSCVYEHIHNCIYESIDILHAYHRHTTACVQFQVVLLSWDSQSRRNHVLELVPQTWTWRTPVTIANEIIMLLCRHWVNHCQYWLISHSRLIWLKQWLRLME